MTKMSKRTTTKRRSRRSRKKKLLTKKRATQKSGHRQHQGKKGKKRRANKRRKYSRKKKPSTDSQNPRLTTGGSLATAAGVGAAALVATYFANMKPTTKIEATAASNAAVSPTPEIIEHGAFDSYERALARRNGETDIAPSFSEEEFLPFNAFSSSFQSGSPTTAINNNEGSPTSVTEEPKINEGAATAASAAITWEKIYLACIIFTVDDGTYFDNNHAKYLHYFEDMKELPNIIYIPKSYATQAERQEKKYVFNDTVVEIKGESIIIREVSNCLIFSLTDTKDGTTTKLMRELFEFIGEYSLANNGADDKLVAIFPLWKIQGGDFNTVYDSFVEVICEFNFMEFRDKFLTVFMLDSKHKPNIKQIFKENPTYNNQEMKKDVLSIYNKNIGIHSILRHTLIE